MNPRVVRLAYALFAVLSLAAFAGPFAIAAALKGGASPDWPPDRPVEWVAAVGITATVVACLVVLGAVGVLNHKQMVAARAGRARP